MSFPADQLALSEFCKPLLGGLRGRGVERKRLSQNARYRREASRPIAQIEDQRGRRVQMVHGVAGGIEDDQAVVGLVDLERVRPDRIGIVRRHGERHPTSAPRR